MVYDETLNGNERLESGKNLQIACKCETLYPETSMFKALSERYH